MPKVNLLKPSVVAVRATSNNTTFCPHGALMCYEYHCCILRGPGGERIVDIVPGGTELELQLKRGVGQAAHTRNNPNTKCTRVY